MVIVIPIVIDDCVLLWLQALRFLFYLIRYFRTIRGGGRAPVSPPRTGVPVPHKTVINLEGIPGHISLSFNSLFFPSLSWTLHEVWTEPTHPLPNILMQFIQLNIGCVFVAKVLNNCSSFCCLSFTVPNHKQLVPPHAQHPGYGPACSKCVCGISVTSSGG